jgi:DEAD/DEAH box helicase domain-containing protein
MHVYKGIYGAHVALILRRLLRLCRQYGAPDPTFICCSATLPRPLALFERLIPRPFSKGAVAVCEDGAPAAQHWLVLWQPPFQNGSGGARADAGHTTATGMAVVSAVKAVPVTNETAAAAATEPAAAAAAAATESLADAVVIRSPEQQQPRPEPERSRQLEEREVGADQWENVDEKQATSLAKKDWLHYRTLTTHVGLACRDIHRVGRWYFHNIIITQD